MQEVVGTCIKAIWARSISRENFEKGVQKCYSSYWRMDKNIKRKKIKCWYTKDARHQRPLLRSTEIYENIMKKCVWYYQRIIIDLKRRKKTRSVVYTRWGKENMPFKCWDSFFRYSYYLTNIPYLRVNMNTIYRCVFLSLHLGHVCIHLKMSGCWCP